MTKDKYILIAGGAGYIGSHTNKALSQKGYKTLVLDNLICGHREHAQWGEFIQGDLKNAGDITSIFNNYAIKAVMHFAAFANVEESVVSPQKYYINNVGSTLHLLQAMVDHGVSNIIFSSSCATYGNPVEIPIRDTQPRTPVIPMTGRSWWWKRCWSITATLMGSEMFHSDISMRQERIPRVTLGNGMSPRLI